ncbi:MAG TPA: hypothetical protein VK139_01165 [Microbacteriaceae bacterium]|nr:hypothetical protein [Microbacteriaceae bacterium]
MIRRLVGVRVLLAGLSGVALATTLALAPASAVGASCPPGSTNIFGTVCQVLFTSSGSISLPAGASKITAVVIGGGSGGSGANANLAGGGAGGDVEYDEGFSVAGGTLTATVGAGGAASVDTISGRGGDSGVSDGTHGVAASGGFGAHYNPGTTSVAGGQTMGNSGAFSPSAS